MCSASGLKHALIAALQPHRSSCSSMASLSRARGTIPHTAPPGTCTAEDSRQQAASSVKCCTRSLGACLLPLSFFFFFFFHVLPVAQRQAKRAAEPEASCLAQLQGPSSTGACEATGASHPPCRVQRGQPRRTGSCSCSAGGCSSSAGCIDAQSMSEGRTPRAKHRPRRGQRGLWALLVERGHRRYALLGFTACGKLPATWAPMTEQAVRKHLEPATSRAGSRAGCGACAAAAARPRRTQRCRC